MLICTCPVPEDCIALGSDHECFPWCEFLKDDGSEEIDFDYAAEDDDGN
jgi:hypothetical protein